MELYISNLPEDATAYDLRRLFTPIAASNTGTFSFLRSRTEPFMNFKIIEQRSAAGMVRYGWADIEPDNIAERCIERLNNSFFHGNAIVVREFFHRRSMNERRAIDWRSRPWNGEERRVNHRRQYYV